MKCRLHYFLYTIATVYVPEWFWEGLIPILHVSVVVQNYQGFWNHSHLQDILVVLNLLNALGLTIWLWINSIFLQQKTKPQMVKDVFKINSSHVAKLGVESQVQSSTCVNCPILQYSGLELAQVWNQKCNHLTELI